MGESVELIMLNDNVSSPVDVALKGDFELAERLLIAQYQWVKVIKVLSYPKVPQKPSELLAKLRIMCEESYGVLNERPEQPRRFSPLDKEKRCNIFVEKKPEVFHTRLKQIEYLISRPENAIIPCLIQNLSNAYEGSIKMFEKEAWNLAFD